jgi:[ribosomal protein S5]-alanine N-acetyltransferase
VRPQQIETTRLKLRPFEPSDIPQLVSLIGAREVAATTLRIPHPYTEEDARAFLAMPPSDEATFAIVLRDADRLCGGMGLRVEEEHRRAELGYWIGVPYWGNGYATEAGLAVLRFGFQQLGLNRIFASHFRHNPASGKVLTKLGMRHEGCLRQHLRKWGTSVDSEVYGILREEWERR